MVELKSKPLESELEHQIRDPPFEEWTFLRSSAVGKEASASVAALAAQVLQGTHQIFEDRLGAGVEDLLAVVSWGSLFERSAEPVTVRYTSVTLLARSLVGSLR